MRHDVPVTPLGGAMILTSILFLSIALGWPQAAGALLRILLIVLSVGFVAASAYESMIAVRTSHRVRSPFDGDVASRTPPAAPGVLRDITLDLGAADDPRRAGRTAIPWSVRRTVIEEASRRLAENHGLSFSDPSHHARIRTLISQPTWELIGHRSARGARAGGSDTVEDAHRAPTAKCDANDATTSAERGRAVPMSELDLILDDLERL